MCSIAGGADRKEVETMLSLMRHRAPDASGIANSKFSIGMGRLAIIDLKSENLCPYKEDEYVLTYNGEVYSYIELRKELKKKGYVFKTTSDTEVVLKAYREWGTQCLDKFNGMFAFAIYDSKKNQIFLARDIAGEKPLYYTEHPFRFASEAKALGFKCKEFPPAHYGIYDFKELKIYRWWSIPQWRLDHSAEELEALIEDSVKLRTRSDVPYALYLSGGVDSSLLSTFHKFEHTITYQDGDYQKEFLETLPKIMWHLDYPIASFSPFGLWKLAEVASKKVKVVLSGEGADELFGGYVRYIQPHFNYLAQQKYPSYRSMFSPAESIMDAGIREFQGNLRDLLRMGDRMSSAFGLENRCPFLDRRIIEFAFTLSDDQKIDGLQTKVILNKILKRRMPQYMPIEKAGLFCNVNEWIGSSDGFGKNDYMALQQRICQGFL